MTLDDKNVIIGLNRLVDDLVRLENYEANKIYESKRNSSKNPFVELQGLKSTLYEDLQLAFDEFKEVNFDRKKLDNDLVSFNLYIDFFDEQCPLFSSPCITDPFSGIDILSSILNNPEKIKVSTEFKSLLKKYNAYIKNPDKVIPEYIDKLKDMHIRSLEDQIAATATTKSELIEELEELNSSSTYKKDIKNNAFNRMFRSRQLQHQETRHALELNINAYNDRLRSLNEELYDVEKYPENYTDHYTSQVKCLFKAIKSAGKFMSSIVNAKEILIDFQKEHGIKSDSVTNLDFTELITNKSNCKRIKNHAKAKIFTFLETACPSDIHDIISNATQEDLPNNVNLNIPRILALIEEFHTLKQDDVPIPYVGQYE